MADITIKRALIAVYDKTGIAVFAKALVEEFGIEIISTGGTARHLKEAGVPVTMVEDVTGFPEMLDGRVKTLHPKIHAGILADRDNPDHMRQLKEQDIKPIDMVVVNLYPFEETVAKPDCSFEEAIEMIDIGGPCMLRAAAKNHKHVVVVGGDQEMWDGVLNDLRERGAVDCMMSKALAAHVFSTTWRYDMAVSGYLLGFPITEDAGDARDDEDAWDDGDACDDGDDDVPWFDLSCEEELLDLENGESLRYGENPHQVAKLFCLPDDPRQTSLADVDPVFESAKDMSHNNYLDASAALDLCEELTRGDLGGRDKAVCFIKHTNACGAAVEADAIEAYRKAYLGDPNAAMGGILAVNFNVDAAFAEAVMGSLKTWGKAAGAGAFFVEVWLAPSFDEDALEVVRERKKWGKNVRLLVPGDFAVDPSKDEVDCKRIAGGMLVQHRDIVGLNEEAWKTVTDRQPTDAEMVDLRLAWLVCKHTKSNAITVCKDGMLIGNGAGQMSRVMSCRIATWLAKENGFEQSLKGAAAASDAFFPFRDGPDILIDAGVTAIIQPGGSKKDQQTIDACNERGIAMIFTGTRHFKH